MHPIIQIGPVPVPTYGLFSAATLLIALWVVKRYARMEGLDPQRTSDGMLLTIIMGFAGARVLEAAINWQRYFSQPGGLKLLLFSSGVYMGALITVVPFGYFWFRHIHVPILVALDLIGLVGSISTGVGRWGCFFSGCCWGTPTTLPWGVTFPEIARRLHRGLPDVPLHPTQIYESLVSLGILGILMLLYRRKRFHGQILCAYVVLYSVARFFLEFVRGDAERGFVFGTRVSTSQLLSLLLATLAVGGYVLLDRRHRLAHEPDWRPAPALQPVPAEGPRGKGARRRRR